MLTDPDHIRSALARRGFHFSKARGQNFLTDASVPSRMADFASKGTAVLEIGAGFGALTEALCQTAGHVLALESDKRLLPVLSGNLAAFDNLTLMEADALTCDIDELFSGFPELEPMVISNLPYSITSPLLEKIIRCRARESVVMVQLEVAQRLTAKPGGKDYSSFGVFCSVFREVSILFEVPPDCFYPRPSVTSAVIGLARRDKPLVPPEEQDLFFRTVRGAFGQRRKQLKNALSAAFPGKDVESALHSAGIDPALRGETLGIDEFLRLSQFLR